VIRFLHVYFPVRTVFLGVSELLLATLAFVAAMIVHLGLLNARIALHYERGGVRLALIVVLLSSCMYFFDLYDSLVLRSRRETFARLAQVLGSVCLILAFVYTVFPAARIDLQVLCVGTTFAGCMLLGWRRLFFFVNSLPALLERTLVLGDGPLARALLEQLESRPELGYRVVCHLTEDQDWKGEQGLCQSLTQELRRVTFSQQVETIVVAMGDRRGRLPVDALLELKKRGVAVQDGAELYEVITGKIALDSLRPSALLFSSAFQVPRHVLLLKRLGSLLLGGCCLILAAPLMALMALAIRLDSPGPVIFRQRRIGKDGKSFTLYKFRSMHHRVDKHGYCRPACVGDERFTRVGSWLRASRLDELPQLWNILRGDMQFVGPRPFVPDQEELCVNNIPFYSYRWTVTPGATGWAQVNRGYCATLEDNAEKLAYDLFYIKHVSIGLDLLILFKTTKSLLLGRGAR
jgi:exopolysaccharide biosynthesis polyprenyl glycosylphosphotransferase